MSEKLTLRLYAGEDFVEELPCLQASLEREAYTPYASMSALFLSEGQDYGEISSAALYYEDEKIYEGIADSVQQYQREGKTFVRVKSRSFTSVLAQNELVPGMHYDMTLEKLMTGFYTFPHVQYENYAGTGYIYVKDGASMWDSTVNFGYKLSGNYPYIRDNMVRLTPHGDTKTTVLTNAQVAEWGELRDTTRMVSMYHMADPEGNYDAYSLENEAATAAHIVRHKQIAMDRQYLAEPEQALIFRNKFSCRGSRARYVSYAGFANEGIRDRVSWGSFLQDAEICRVQMVYSGRGMRTKLWAYDDGFYHISV